ncbi:hypothetical protein D9M68_910040 [compost metagenome]
MRILVVEKDALVDFDPAFARKLPDLDRLFANFGSLQKHCRPQGRNQREHPTMQGRAGTLALSEYRAGFLASTKSR